MSTNRFFEKITTRLPYREIRGDNGEPYLERYFVCEFPDWRILGKWRGGAVYIHRFVDSDPDRGLHDHPWRRAYSLILSGSYDEVRWLNIWEHTFETVRKRAGNLTRINGADQHRVVLRDGVPAWSLFWHSGRVKGWGFYGTQQGVVTGFAFCAEVEDPDRKQWWKTAQVRGKG
ncbi:hypothetical protein [Paremcibacter congregatus]|uniref:hypothetical protein n=1 Tax=Paremcibacter congregatus TaxID=2043170 RepID=UPI0030EE0E1A